MMKKILVGLSGGVDSAIAAYLLKKQGYEVVAGFMKNYVDDENPNCSTYKDANEAIKVADFLGIEILSFDLRQEYEDKIIKYIYEGYQKGITPNPDILCNTLIKFDVFLEKALDAGFDGIATGHYARINNIPPTPLNKGGIPKASLSKGGPTEYSVGNGLSTWINNIPPTPLNKGGYLYKLLRGVDYNKDQSYFLSGLNQFQLSKSLFPIGGMTKPQVRELAKKIGLPNCDRPDSQGLCFIGNVPMREFLKKRLPIQKGDIVLMDGTKVGEHDGAYFFTIGQSRGLDINRKAYVIKTDIKNNLVFVSFDREEPELVSKKIIVKHWHWIGEKKQLPLTCSTKIRYRQEPNPSIMDMENEEIIFTYKENQWGVAPGQSVVAYLGDECLGGGII